MQIFVQGFRDGVAAGKQEQRGTLNLGGEPHGRDDPYYLEGFRVGFLRGYSTDLLDLSSDDE